MHSQETIKSPEILNTIESKDSLEEEISRGESLIIKTENNNEQASFAIETLPTAIDKKPFKEQLEKLKELQQQIKETIVLASFLAATSGPALAVSPQEKGIELETTSQEQSPSSVIPLNSINPTLEAFTGAATIAIKNLREEAVEATKGTTAEGKELGLEERVQKGSSVISRLPSKITGPIGQLASLIDTAVDIKKDLEKGNPADAAIRVTRMIANAYTYGIGTLIWDMLKKNTSQEANMEENLNTAQSPSQESAQKEPMP